MNKNSVQIVGACWENLGDRLMVQAIQEELEGHYYQPFPIILNSPASQFWGPKNMTLMFGQAVKRSFQFVRHGLPKNLLDCSGYQYGDPWADMSKILSLRLLVYQNFKSRGGKIIMMPQTFGPFEDKMTASVAAGVFQLADHIFTRDETSLNHALSIGCPLSRISIMPDYSNITEPELPDNTAEWNRRVGIVPSVRMLDKTSDNVSSSYAQTLEKCVGWITDHEMEPFLLVHDLEDKKLVTKIAKTLPRKILIVNTTPPKTKGIIACSRAILGSRYHALSSALSQATPAIGTGWTHKYKSLFQDYDCSECLIEHFQQDSLEQALNLVCCEPGRTEIVNKLRLGAKNNKARTREMFRQLKDIIDKE